MKIKQILTIVVILLAALSLAACGGAEPAEDTTANDQTLQEDQVSQINTQVAETLRAEMQQTIAAQPTATNTPEATPTNPILATNTLLPTMETVTPFPTLPALPTSTPQPTTSSVTTGGRPCYRAEMLFESPKDGQSYFPGEGFIKYWNFANAGDCEWNSNFNLIHVGGPNLSDYGSYNLMDISNMTEDGIPNGGKLEIAISMQAPDSTGNYKSIWMFRTDNNEIFGVGDLGNEVFWVQIVVRN
jgi:hypothetical protein